MIRSIRRHPRYKLVLRILLLVSLFILVLLNQAILNDPVRISFQDFSQFWASGKLNFEGENPYNPISIQEIKNSISGIQEDLTIVSVTYNPPWLMPVLMVFSWIPYSISRLIWLLMNISILLFCAIWLWQFYGGVKEQRWIAYLAVISFGPVFLVLRQGQLTPFLLLGMIGFLHQIENKRNDLLAGFFAALISIKPQLFYLFWVALLFWVIFTKRWQVLVGFFVSIVIATFISGVFNHNIIPQYVAVLINYSPIAWITPTIGYYLRTIFGLEKFWLQFVAPLWGLIWFIWYWLRHKNSWSWKEVMPALLFASLLTLPYGWTYDLVLLILPVIFILIKLLRSSRRGLILATFVIFGTINLVYFLMMLEFKEQYFGWYIIALFLWYWAALRIYLAETGSKVGKI